MLNKTKLKKYISAIKKSKKKCFYVRDLSFEVGLKEEVLKKELVEYYPLIAFDDNFNLKDLLPVLEEELLNLENNVPKKKKEITKKDYDSYDSFVEYIYETMCDNGLLNLGYKLTSKDIKIITKLLKKEKDELK